jgi:hypothetical protein
MDDPGKHRRTGRWIVPTLAVMAFVSAVLTVSGVVDPVPAFFGAVLVSLVVGIAWALVNNGAGLRPSPLTLRGVVGILVWVLAVAAVVYLALTWSDFATP